MERKGFINGFMEAGLALDLVNNEDLGEVIEEVNFEIFGMSVTDRRKKYSATDFSLEEYIKIPTYIRVSRKTKK